VRSGALAENPAVVFASEQMDEDRGWLHLEPGWCMWTATSRSCGLAIDRPPAKQLRLEDLQAHVAASQQHGPS
jgi:hypothetical protein